LTRRRAERSLARAEAEDGMAKVLGIGGVFVKAQDTAALAAWYGRVLGFPIEEWGGAMWPPPDRGFSIWSAHKADTTYFDPSPHALMVNLMVDDIDGVLAHAAAEGVEPLGREDGEFGRFAWLMDPVGVKLELWEPPEG
jgi:predicted enzyme related to lactoylglutathione lyase